VTDRELLEYIAAQVGTLTGKVDTLTGKVDMLTNDVDELEEGQSRLEKTVTKIEQEHGKKIEALLDGYKQNTEQLDRIEKEVSMHEEIILR